MPGSFQGGQQRTRQKESCSPKREWYEQTETLRRTITHTINQRQDRDLLNHSIYPLSFPDIPTCRRNQYPQLFLLRRRQFPLQNTAADLEEVSQTNALLLRWEGIAHIIHENGLSRTPLPRLHRNCRFPGTVPKGTWRRSLASADSAASTGCAAGRNYIAPHRSTRFRSPVAAFPTPSSPRRRRRSGPTPGRR